MSTFSMDAGSIAELWRLMTGVNNHFARVRRFLRLDYEFEIESDGLFVLNGYW